MRTLTLLVALLLGAGAYGGDTPPADLAALLKTDWKSLRITAADNAAIGSTQVHLCLCPRLARQIQFRLL
ncbi:MAG TPA: hypothetical protein VG733_14020 [Chthoniobacteraceae bacterium]|nr:hypothetical protein [Chthoniobacteraceae bacterium]